MPLTKIYTYPLPQPYIQFIYLLKNVFWVPTKTLYFTECRFIEVLVSSLNNFVFLEVNYK